jgi:hypothetical protein
VHFGPWERRAAEPELGRRAGKGMVEDPLAGIHRSPIQPPFRRRGPRGFLPCSGVLGPTPLGIQNRWFVPRGLGQENAWT